VRTQDCGVYSGRLVLEPPPNNPLQRSGMVEVLGRRRGEVALKQVMRARVLMRGRPAAERGC
jgi:hypothetical protein